jgi:hypothetical protein
MAEESTPDAEVEGWLKALGVQSLCQWDVLIFLYRHQTTLVGAEYLACLLGYAAEPVVAALDALDSLGLVARSRVSQGARLYQFTAPSLPSPSEAFDRLRTLARDRAGRLRLSKQLQPNHRLPPVGPEATRRFRDRALHPVRVNKRPPRDFGEGRQLWRRAI